METSNVVRKINLSDLNPEIKNGFIVGIIIAKGQPYTLHENKESTSKAEGAVWNFVIRDSPFYYANVICWGSKPILLELDQKFKVGVVVNIVKPEIELQDSNLDKLTPIISSLFSLNLRGNVSAKIIPHEGSIIPYVDLMHFVTKPVANATNIADIQNFKTKQDGVDIFGIIRFIGNVEDVLVDDQLKPMRELILIDQTSAALRVQFLDSEIIMRAQTWKISNTVLLITNAYCEWSNCSGAMVAIPTSRSIITEDPLAPETSILKQFFSGMDSSALVDSRAVYPHELSSIQDPMTIKEVLEMSDYIMSEVDTTLEEQQFTAIVYAMISHVKFDGLSRLISLNCSRCGILLGNVTSPSANSNKCKGIEQEHSNTMITFDLRVVLTDHTDSLINCRLYGKTAERVLNCSVEEYIEMNDVHKSALETKILMKFCTARIHVMTVGFRGPTVSILSCDWTPPVQSAEL